MTHVWDTKLGSQAAALRDSAMAVGPGPGGSTMVLSKYTVANPGGILLHDAASGKLYVLADSSKKLIHAFAGKIVYAATPAEQDERAVFVADIVMPKETGKSRNGPSTVTPTRPCLEP